jgi:hypothetical protein
MLQEKGHVGPGTAEHPWGGKIMHFVDTVVFGVGKSQQVGGFPRLHAQKRAHTSWCTAANRREYRACIGCRRAEEAK